MSVTTFRQGTRPRALAEFEKFSQRDPRGARTMAHHKNTEFFEASRNNPQALVKMSNDTGQRLADYLRESSIANQVIPQQDIDYSELEQGYATDTPLYRLYLTQETTAYKGTFEGGSQSTMEQYFARVFFSFLLLRTGTVSVNEYNAATYPFPVIPFFEERQGIDLEEAFDLLFFRSVEESIQVQRDVWRNVIRGEEAAANITGDGISSGFEGKLVPNDLSKVKRYFASHRSKSDAQVIVMPEPNYLDLEEADGDAVGDIILARFFDEGVTQENVRGCKIVRTIKCDPVTGDTFRTGNIYAFSAPEGWGRNLVLRAPRMFVERHRNDVSFDCETVRGWGIITPSRLCKLELYNGGVPAGSIRDRDTVASPVDIITELSGTVPASDTMYSRPEQVLGKDYVRLGDDAIRPYINPIGM